MFYDNNDHSDYLGFTWQRCMVGKVPVGIDTNDTDFDLIGKTGGGKQIIIPMQWYNDFIDMRLKQIAVPNWETYRKEARGNTTTFSGESSYTGVMGLNENTTSDTNGNLQPYEVVSYWRRVS